MKIEWSGKTSSYHHKWNDTPNPPGEDKGLRKTWLLDAQWSDCPIEVYEQVRDLWRYLELGNDNYISKSSVNDLLELQDSEAEVEVWDDVDIKWKTKPIQLDAIIQYIREHDIADDEQVIIHYWW